MPAKRPKNVRRGDRAEELGLCLLGGIAAVAPVPRPHDVGLDAVATLLRPTSGRNVIAEESFWVQLKSSSVSSELVYKGEEVAWLTALQLPFFLGIVSLKEARLSLFPCHKAFEFLLANTPPAIRLTPNLGSVSFSDDPIPGTACVSLGPPAHEWTVADLADPTFDEQTYSVLKQWLGFEQRNAELRKIGFFLPLTWQTGNAPRNEGYCVCQRPKEGRTQLMEIILPHVLVLAHDCRLRGEHDHLRAFELLFNWMRENGVEPDPGSRIVRAIKTWAETDPYPEPRFPFV